MRRIVRNMQGRSMWRERDFVDFALHGEHNVSRRTLGGRLNRRMLKRRILKSMWRSTVRKMRMRKEGRGGGVNNDLRLGPR